MSSTIISDLKQNVMYVTEQLKGLKVDLKTSGGKYLSLHDFMEKAETALSDVSLKKKESKLYNDNVVATILALNFIPPGILSNQQIHLFCAGFQLGQLFDRVRRKREVTIVVDEFEMNAAEMDGIIAKYQGAPMIDEDNDGTEE